MNKTIVSVFAKGMEKPIEFEGSDWDDCLEQLFESNVLQMTEMEEEEEEVQS